jgi:membrane fusion protein, multidrug efflux system
MTFTPASADRTQRSRSTGPHRGPLRALLAAALFAAPLAAPLAAPARAATLDLAPVEVTEWKSVYATVEARRVVPARARIGGTVTALAMTEGDSVAAGAELGRVTDDKLDFQLASLQAQIAASEAQLANAQAESARVDALVAKGIQSAQQLDAMRTRVDVVEGQLLALRADRDRVTQTQAEGAVLAPAEGVVLTVPVSAGEVVLPGEPLATIGSGGFFLRLQVPERYGEALREGNLIGIGEGDKNGRLAKIYPQIEGGRVQADIEVDGLESRFVGARIAVRLPVGSRMALAVPAAALTHRGGLDFVTVETAGGQVERVVVPGGPVEVGGENLIEIVSGLAAGARVVLPE